MTIKQGDFIKRITDKSNKDTFGNGTRSALAVYNTKDYQTANQIAHDNLKNPIIQSAVHEILNKLDAGIEHRIGILWDIGQAKTTRTTKIYKVTDKKLVLTEVIKADPTHQERIKAMDVINRLGGDYEKVRVAREIAIDRYRQLRKDILKGAKDKKAAS